MSARPSKYRNVATVVDGIRFASKAEAKRYGELKLLERDGEISLLHWQHPFELVVNGSAVGKYIADFSYTERDRAAPHGRRAVCEDVKGYATPEFKLKWAICKAMHPAIDWRIVKVRA